MIRNLPAQMYLSISLNYPYGRLAKPGGLGSLLSTSALCLSLCIYHTRRVGMYISMPKYSIHLRERSLEDLTLFCNSVMQRRMFFVKIWSRAKKRLCFKAIRKEVSIGTDICSILSSCSMFEVKDGFRDQLSSSM